VRHGKASRVCCYLWRFLFVDRKGGSGKDEKVLGCLVGGVELLGGFGAQGERWKVQAEDVSLMGTISSHTLFCS
jgi:hypothetical protein